MLGQRVVNNILGNKPKADCKSRNNEKYYEDDDGILRGVCKKHGEFIGDAIGCPKCFAEEQERGY